MGLAPGKQFEKDFTDSIPVRCDITRLKDAGGWSNATNMRFTPKNPCDMIVFATHENRLDRKNMYKLELKTCKKKSLPYGNIKPKNHKGSARLNSIIFVKALYESEKKGVIAQFIVNFSELNETYRVRASQVLGFLESSDRASIPIAWFREVGILIEQTLKIKHFRYDLEWL